MVRRSVSVGRAYVLVLAVAAIPSAAHAQSADLVLCDRIAADPADPDKPKDVKGVNEVAASDISTAIKFRKIAAAGSRRAMYQLGRAYAGGKQMPEAIAAYRKAIEKGSSSAMVELGVMYANGIGVARDAAQARALFERAAAQNHPGALERMGAFAQSGRAGPGDKSAAKEFYRRAAELGNEEAKAALKRIECPYVIADKRGKAVTNLCF